LATSRLDGFDHSLSDVRRRLVFPSSENHPAVDLKPLIRIAVAFTIAPNLLSPERRVRSGDGVVFRAAVPEAPIYEDSDLLTRKDQVGSSIQRPERLVVDPIAETSGVDETPDGNLRLRVAPAVALHRATYAGRRRPAACHLSAPVSVDNVTRWRAGHLNQVVETHKYPEAIGELDLKEIRSPSGLEASDSLLMA